MNKTLIAIASATIALSTFASSSAEAGFFGHHHGGGLIGAVLRHTFHHHCERPAYIVRTAPVERVYVSHPARQVIVNQDDDETPAPKQVAAVAHNENSSIAVASADLADNQGTESVENIIVKKDKTAKPAKVAEASTETTSVTPKRLDCKQFFPSVGMTLSVPCE